MGRLRDKAILAKQRGNAVKSTICPNWRAYVASKTAQWRSNLLAECEEAEDSKNRRRDAEDNINAGVGAPERRGTLHPGHAQSRSEKKSKKTRMEITSAVKHKALGIEVIPAMINPWLHKSIQKIQKVVRCCLV